MKRTVQWSREALDDLKNQVAYIADDNPEAAIRVADKIREVGIALGNTPTGRQGRVTGTYEKSIYGLPYIMAYAVTHEGDGEVISILRVIHTARDWKADEWPDRR